MLDQRLREATDDVRAALADIAPPPFDEAVAAGDRTVAYPSVGWRGPLIAIGTAAMMLLVVAMAALLLRGDGISTEPAVTGLESVTTLPFTTIDVESMEWSRVPLSKDVIGVRLDTDVKRPDRGFGFTSVAAGGPGYVAVGYQICEGTTACQADAAVWISPDGITWARIQDNPELWEGEGLRWMEDVTSDGSRLVAVGVGFDEPGVYGLAAAVWTSTDGTDWARVPHDPDVFGGIDSGRVGSQGWMNGVVAGGPGFVAVGNDRGRAAVWTSTNGTNWTRVPHDPEVFSLAEIRAVTVGGPGLVAVGSAGGSSAAVWTSPDGVAWSRVPHDEEVFGGTGNQLMHDVVSGGPGLVAVGEDEPRSDGRRAAVWISPDGMTWTRVPHDLNLFGEGEVERTMRSIVSAGHGLVAAGSDVWISQDGISWSLAENNELSGVEGPEIAGMALADYGLLAVGDADGLPAIWKATTRSNGPEERFSYGDDFTLWVTTEEMRGFLDELSAKYNNSAPVDTVSITVEGPRADDAYRIWHHFKAGSAYRGGWEVGVAVCPGTCYPGHFSPNEDSGLPVGIVYAGPGFGANLYSYQARHSDEQITVTLAANAVIDEGVGQEASFLLASLILQEMGWAN